MSDTPVTLIVSTHDQLEFLARVLRAVAAGASKPDQVVLADDGSGPATSEIFHSWLAQHKIEGRHAWQVHQGFRKSRILNLAMAAATGAYIVFLDGDTVPHPLFIADHRKLAERGFFVQGHRALIGQKGAARFGLGSFPSDRLRALLSGQLSGWKHAFRWPRPLIGRRDDLRGIRGCNLGAWRDDLVRVNGYNEAFIGWGREDSEFAVRLMNSGVRRKDARGWALSYHLWHPPASRSGVPANDDLLNQAIAQRLIRCEHGLGGHQ